MKNLDLENSLGENLAGILHESESKNIVIVCLP